MEYQARGIPMSDPNPHQYVWPWFVRYRAANDLVFRYSLRLQSNLTWLAAAADDNHKVVRISLHMSALLLQPTRIHRAKT